MGWEFICGTPHKYVQNHREKLTGIWVQTNDDDQFTYFEKIQHSDSYLTMPRMEINSDGKMKAFYYPIDHLGKTQEIHRAYTWVFSPGNRALILINENQNESQSFVIKELSDSILVVFAPEIRKR